MPAFLALDAGHVVISLISNHLAPPMHILCMHDTVVHRTNDMPMRMNHAMPHLAKSTHDAMPGEAHCLSILMRDATPHKGTLSVSAHV